MIVESLVVAFALAFPGEMPNAVQPKSEATSSPGEGARRSEAETASSPGEGARPSEAEAASSPGEGARPSEVKQKQPASPAMHQVEVQIIKYTNAERARHGLPPLKADDTLLKSARKHTIWMTTRRTLTHTRQAVAENIALGQQSAREVVRSWMNSSGHRANILSRRHGRIGVAAFVARDGRIYWCQQFN
ncbi:MAG TPA: CAP domain-containing protein [Pirellulales bacterium]|nr:CAP domain-containing protein [Pirellulales bacterium]